MVSIVIVALCVCAGGAYFYFSKSAEASGGAAEHEKAAEAKGNDHDNVTHFSFVELPPLILPILDNNGVQQTVSMIVTIEVKDDKARDIVRALTPRLKDAYIQNLYGALNRHASIHGGAIEVSTIKKKLHAVTVDVIGEEYVHDVLLQVVQQRPI